VATDGPALLYILILKVNFTCKEKRSTSSTAEKSLSVELGAIRSL